MTNELDDFTNVADAILHVSSYRVDILATCLAYAAYEVVKELDGGQQTGITH